MAGRDGDGDGRKGGREKLKRGLPPSLAKRRKPAAPPRKVEKPQTVYDRHREKDEVDEQLE